MTNEALKQFSYFTKPMRAGRTVGLVLFVITIFLIVALAKKCSAADLMKSQAIEDPSEIALEKFIFALQQSDEQKIRIIHYGDSHVAADWLTGKMRTNFQSDFGRENVSYEQQGINGARATKPLGWNWKLINAEFAKAPPSLIVIAYGTNEAGDADLDLGSYKIIFSRLLQRFKEAAPEASLLVIAPPDRAIFRDGKWRSFRILPALIEVQKEAAFENGAAFWNQYEAMGGAGAINAWAQHSPTLAQKDRAHLTLAGYQLIANSLYSSLMNEYENFQK
jgi:lysophospholipase L1-like esterase